MDRVLSIKLPYSLSDVYLDAHMLFASLCSEEGLWKALYVRSVVADALKRKTRLDDIVRELVKRQDNTFFRSLEEKKERFLHCDVPFPDGETALEIGFWFEEKESGCKMTAQIKAYVGFLGNLFVLRRAKKAVQALFKELKDILSYRDKHPQTNLDDEAEMERWKKEKIALLEAEK